MNIVRNAQMNLGPRRRLVWVWLLGACLAAPVSSPTAAADEGAASGTTILAPTDSAKSVESLLSDANQAYQQGDQARAIELYQAALARGTRNGHLYFNLGNAYQRLGKTGQSIYNYLRAQLYLPRDGDVEANLAYARARTRDKAEPGEESWARRLFFWYDRVSDFELFWATVLLNLIFWTLLMLRWKVQLASLRWAIVLSGMGAVLSGGTAIARAVHYSQSPEGVVLVEEISVRSGTDVHSVRLFTLHEGTEVHTRGASGAFVQIELPDGKRGWVERQFIGLVKP